VKFKQQIQVLGCKGFKGSVEGKAYDSTTLFTVMEVSEKAGTSVGFSVAEMKFGTEAEFQKLKGLTFPLIAELEIELTTKGPECVGFKALHAVNPAKA